MSDCSFFLYITFRHKISKLTTERGTGYLGLVTELEVVNELEELKRLRWFKDESLISRRRGVQVVPIWGSCVAFLVRFCSSFSNQSMKLKWRANATAAPPREYKDLYLLEHGCSCTLPLRKVLSLLNSELNVFSAYRNFDI